MQVLESSLSYYLYHWFLNDISFDWQAQNKSQNSLSKILTNVSRISPTLKHTRLHLLLYLPILTSLFSAISLQVTEQIEARTFKKLQQNNWHAQ